MEPSTSENKEALIKLIESQQYIDDRYSDIKRINRNAGNGCFSLVFTAKDNLTKGQKRVVLKILNPFIDDYRKQCFDREANILKKLKNQKNILPLIQEKTEFFLKKNGVFFPIPLNFYSSHLARFDVSQYIYKEDSNYLTNILFFREMCKAVQRIHGKKIYHRDLKPGNFFVYNKNNICLGDFGTARYFDEKAATILSSYSYPVGDMRYAAPELLCMLYFSDYHNYCADIYSLGLILFELFTKTSLGPYIYGNEEQKDLIMHFRAIPEKNRIKVFDEFIESFAASKNLFSVRIYDETIPKAIANEVDILYKGMACLDYRMRMKDFERIFLRINICENTIKYFKKIDTWKIKKEKRKEGALC